MAIAFDTEVQSLQVTSATISLSTTTATGNEVIFIGIANQNSSGLSAVTVDGNAATLIDSQSDGTVSLVYLYYYVAASSGSHSISLTRISTTNSWCAFASAYSGAATTGIPDNHTKGQGGASVMTGTLTTVASNAWTIMMCYDGNQGLAASTGSTVRGSVVILAYGIFDSNGPKTGSTSQSVTVHQLGGTAYVMASFAPPVPPQTAHGAFFLNML